MPNLSRTIANTSKHFEINEKGKKTGKAENFVFK
jgi:hypothetical protein